MDPVHADYKLTWHGLIFRAGSAHVCQQCTYSTVLHSHSSPASPQVSDHFATDGLGIIDDGTLAHSFALARGGWEHPVVYSTVGASCGL